MGVNKFRLQIKSQPISWMQISKQNQDSLAHTETDSTTQK